MQQLSLMGTVEDQAQKITRMSAESRMLETKLTYQMQQNSKEKRRLSRK